MLHNELFSAEKSGLHRTVGIYPVQINDKRTFRVGFGQETDTHFPQSMAEKTISVGSVPHFVAVRPYI